MVAISFPLTSMPGQNPQEGAGRLINAYAEPLGEGSRWPATRRRVPGLAEFATSAQENFRGMVGVGATGYAVFDGQVYRFTSTGGAMVAHEPLAGEDKCFFAVNNNATADCVVVDPGEGAFVITTLGVDDYPDSDVGSPNACCFLDGYIFFTYGDGACQATGINSTSVNTLDRVRAEAKSDTLYRPVPFNSQLFLCGSGSIEVWSGNPVNDEGFPFNRVTVIQRGIAGRYAIAGFEDGFGKALIFVGDDNAVYMLNGYSPEKISPPDLDRRIESIADKDTLEACVYMSNGRAVWVLSSDDWTWEFNINSLKWNERESYLRPRWRATQSKYLFGKWLAGDIDSGNVYQISSATRTEAGEALIQGMESAPIHKFPNRAQIARIDLDITVGVGIATGADPNQTDPTIEISVSRDGGVNYDPPRIVKVGKQAIANQRVYATRFGLSTAHGMKVRARISDQVDIGVMGGEASAALRTSAGEFKPLRR